MWCVFSLAIGCKRVEYWPFSEVIPHVQAWVSDYSDTLEHKSLLKLYS
jgi:hypothetical protein